ncbi:triple tyrosine motif-containing protein [Pedobacter metabolipauper]|uniref:YXYXY domain-containing protein n=1 Tax=Pedobacter metabolipauper TaxID=425513 RepID=A0A4V3D0R0_9SPHI|nr:triple tyrosine motif-containing protein [Pedobacter metabolipauper]TDQ06998.1 YXYXY domain-containing protein [Pedobacter metabolipauper]
MSKSLIIILLLCAFTHSRSLSQIATPQILNYTNDNYKAGIQNWDLAQDRNGILYFANNEGLLTFNGRFWNLIRLPNLTCVRSVEIDHKNRIFVGGQDEAGYYFPEENGILKYHSIIPLVPEKYRKFADVWNVSILEDAVVFRTTNVILYYKDGVVKAYPPDVSWEFAGKGNNKLFAHSKGKGLMIFDDGAWMPYCNDPVLNRSAVTSMMEYNKDTLLVSTLKNGLFLMVNGQLIPKKTSFDQTFYNDRIYAASKIDTDKYVIGTTSGGIMVINKNGRLIQKYTYKDGLQNNNVRGIITDKNKNLWLALDDGIDYIAINSAVKNIFPDKNKQVTSYAIRSFNQTLYIGTSNGLYATPIEPGIKDLSLSKGSFSEVPNSKGQVWNLDEINNKLLMAHEDGFFIVENNKAKQIYAVPGTWLFEPVSDVFPSNHIIAGTYLGLQKISYANGNFTNGGKIEGRREESLRFIAFDSSNHIWASHPYHGVYKMELSADYRKIKKYTLFTDREGLPSHLYNYVFKIKNRVVVATEDGVYEYDEAKRRFKPFQLLYSALKGLSLQYLKEDNLGNVWFVSDKKVGILDFSQPSKKQPFSVHYFPQLDGKVVGGFESVYFLNPENIFIGANKGAYHVNYSKYLQNISKPTILIGSVKLFGKKDSVIFGGYFMKGDGLTEAQDLSKIMKLSNGYSSLHFEYSSTLFEHQTNIEFSYQLIGFDKSWSPWNQKSEKDYTNLPAGKYTFNVKARNSFSNESEITSYTFEILPAWYQTIWMYLLYIIILAIIIHVSFKWQKEKHTIAQARLSYLHQLELDRSEKEIVRLEYEKLEADVNYKNRELSNMTMHLVQRGKVLARIKEVISTIIKNHDINDSSPSFRHLIRLIRDVEKSDQDWDNFSMHFNTVNTDFFNTLKDQFPDLTPNELKLSAYLKMNLSTKEIAQLMNITIKAVEIGRYRLRKKLHLSPETNLYDFLIKVSRNTKQV